ncbi:MAG: hypothetical protein ABIT71_25920 [Vicinamibacteraceae bacterium]
MIAGKRGRRGAVTALALALMVGAPGARVPGQTQTPAPTPWPFQLEWDHDGDGLRYYQLCVNGQCSMLEAWRGEGTQWRALLPVLPQGEYLLVVQACGSDACLPNTPDLAIRVLPPSRDGSPIDVLPGPDDDDEDDH